MSNPSWPATIRQRLDSSLGRSMDCYARRGNTIRLWRGHGRFTGRLARSWRVSRWLRALVWPGQEQRARQLTQALDLLAEDPPHVVRGDAIDVLASLDGQVDTTRPVVVFHAATIAHIPGDRRPDLQRAIDALGEQRPVYHLSLEGTREPIPELDGKPGHLLSLTTPRASDPRHLAAVDGHGEWIAPTRP